MFGAKRSNGHAGLCNGEHLLRGKHLWAAYCTWAVLGKCERLIQLRGPKLAKIGERIVQQYIEP